MRLRALAFPALFAGLTNTLAAVVLTDGLFASIVGAVIGTVGLTLAVVAWLDRRIEHKMKGRQVIERLRFQILLREISNLRELAGHPPLDVPEMLKLVSGDKE